MNTSWQVAYETVCKGKLVEMETLVQRGSGKRPATLSKKRLPHICFPAKFLRTFLVDAFIKKPLLNICNVT